MLTRASNDALVVARCTRTGLVVSFADVLETAALLSGRHACGPTAAAWLAEGLVGTALLGGTLQSPTDLLTLDLECDGPLVSLHAGLSGAGSMYGWPGVGDLGELDQIEDTPSPEEVLGSLVRLGLGCGDPPMTVHWRHVIDGPAAPLEAILQGGCGAVTGHPALLTLVHEVADGLLGYAQGLMVQRPPEPSRAGEQAFVRALALFEDGTVAAALAADASLDALRALLDLPGLTIERTLRLAFGCNCTRDEARTRAAEFVAAHGVPASDKPCSVHCPRCAEDYLFTRRELEALREPPRPGDGTEERP